MKTSPLLERYRGLVDESQLTAIYDVASSLQGLKVLHLNTTDQGGGVAEILHELLPVMEELGIRHSWKIVPLDEASGYFSARVVDMLQGYDMGEFPETEKKVFLEKLRSLIQRDRDYQADMYFIHDFQLAPLAQLYPWMRPALWYCHVDTAQPNPSAQAYIQQYLDPYEIVCFNSEASVFKDLPHEKTRVVMLGIDPFRVKNRCLPQARGLEILARCGIDTERPLITQVSRFGIWKNPWQVIDIYRLIKQNIPTVQLAMVGAMEAKDDFKAQEILLDLQKYYVDGDPDVHLLSDPTQIGHEEVNAFQRYSSVILQRSIREGFGFTVTEAMWKNQPVVGTSVTGLRMQITHGYNGYLVDDTETAAEYTQKLLADRELWRTLGENARESVRKRFLFPTLILGYLQALLQAYTKRSNHSESEIACHATTVDNGEIAA